MDGAASHRDGAAPRSTIRFDGVRKVYGAHTGDPTPALETIDLELPGDHCFISLIGPSGCGKTTAGRAILRLIEPTSGRIMLRTGDGTMKDILQLDKSALKQVRQRLQVVFQDPYGSLNPRKSVFQIVGEPLLTHLGLDKAAARTERARPVACPLVSQWLQQPGRLPLSVFCGTHAQAHHP